MESGLKKLKIAICGGGNGAHCFTALASSLEHVEVKVLTIYEDEAERWTNKLKRNTLTATHTSATGITSNIQGNPSLVTKDPSTALSDAQIIFLVVPSYAHEIYLKTILQFVKPNMLIVGLPGHAGFELQCRHMLGEKSKTCTILGFESLPWACRIIDYGSHVQLIGYKNVLKTSFLVGRECNLPFPAIESVQSILGKKPRVEIAKNVFSSILMSGSIIHPPIMYGQWKDWDGVPLPEKPLFYQGVNDLQAELLFQSNAELLATGNKIQQLEPSLVMTDLVPITDWYKSHYPDDIVDGSSLLTSLITNKAYAGLFHPMKTTENGFVPDFDYRYTREDIPYGLVVMKGVAELVGVATPVLDKIISWAQEILKKEYLVGKSLTGKDIKNVRAPQSYGLTSLQEVLDFFNSHMLYKEKI